MSTNAQAVVDHLVDIFERESGTLLRYVVEVSRAPTVSGRDPDALSKLEDVYRESDLALKSLEAILGENRRLARHTHWPLQYTTYNFLRPIYLLEPVAENMERHLDIVANLAGKLEELGASSEASQVNAIVGTGRSSVDVLRALAKEVVEADPAPANLKGTSASRW